LDSSVLESGVLVQVNSDADPVIQRAARFLIDTLNGLGIITKGPLPSTQGIPRAVIGMISCDPDARIRIVISKKP
jgi:hypothetical protein